MTDYTPSGYPPPGAAPATGGSFVDRMARDDYAGFWRRVLASIIDSIIVSIPQVAIVLAAGWSLTDNSDPRPNLVGLVLAFAYMVYFHSSARQATPGKMALGIVVTDIDGNRLSVGRAAGRYLATLLSAIILGIGFIMVAFTKNKQGLHDLIADTLVVQKDAMPADKRPA